MALHHPPSSSKCDDDTPLNPLSVSSRKVGTGSGIWQRRVFAQRFVEFLLLRPCNCLLRCLTDVFFEKCRCVNIYPFPCAHLRQIIAVAGINPLACTRIFIRRQRQHYFNFLLISYTIQAKIIRTILSGNWKCAFLSSTSSINVN